MPKANKKTEKKKVCDGVASTSASTSTSSSCNEISVRKFYSESQAAEAILTNQPLTKKAKMVEERKWKKNKIQQKWIMLCNLVQPYMYLYDMGCEDWKNNQLKKHHLERIMEELNKEFGDGNTGFIQSLSQNKEKEKTQKHK